MAGNNEIKVRYRLLIFGELNDKKFRQDIKRKAKRCFVAGLVRILSDDKLEIILEGEKRAATKVFVWVLKKPRLVKIRRLESSTETFLNEFKGFQVK